MSTVVRAATHRDVPELVGLRMVNAARPGFAPRGTTLSRELGG
jgi:hypothetical protein